MFCPVCKAEYIEGITQCADCKIPLVERLPGEEQQDNESREKAEDLFPIMTFLDNEEALIAKGFLESNGVEAILSSEETFRAHRGLSSPQGIRLLIRKEDQGDAEKIFLMAGIHPQEMPYFHRRESPLTDMDNKRKRVAARIIFILSLLALILLLLRQLLG
jgi:hypothetical protein